MEEHKKHIEDQLKAVGHCIIRASEKILEHTIADAKDLEHFSKTLSNLASAQGTLLASLGYCNFKSSQGASSLFDLASWTSGGDA